MGLLVLLLGLVVDPGDDVPAFVDRHEVLVLGAKTDVQLRGDVQAVQPLDLLWAQRVADPEGTAIGILQ